MFDAVGLSLHPSRWQWLVAKYSVHGLKGAVRLLIATTIAATLWCVSPYALPPDLAAWGIWLPAQLAVLMVQLYCLMLQFVDSTVLMTSHPVTTPDGLRVGLRRQLATLVATRDCQLIIVAYLGLCAGTYLLGHAPNVGVLIGAVVPLWASLIAFGDLLDSVRAAKPTSSRPALNDPAVGDSYTPVNSTSERYGMFWYDPAQLQTLATARAYASMVAQHRFNILFVNAGALTLISLLSLLPPYTVGPLLVLRATILISSYAVAISAGERLGRLKKLHDEYVAKVAELEKRR